MPFTLFHFPSVSPTWIFAEDSKSFSRDAWSRFWTVWLLVGCIVSWMFLVVISRLGSRVGKHAHFRVEAWSFDPRFAGECLAEIWEFLRELGIGLG
jgi:hypothetical protein